MPHLRFPMEIPIEVAPGAPGGFDGVGSVADPLGEPDFPYDFQLHRPERRPLALWF